jgi:hypothetical protein
MRCWSITLSLALAACFGLSLPACSGGGGTGGDAGAGCPSSPPQEGAACFGNGITCSYGQTQGNCGGGSVAVCQNGTWSYAATGGPPGYAACPISIPTQGSPCSVSGCGGAQPSCSYGCGQGGPAYATCNGSTWQVTLEGVGCAVDASVEAGDGGDASEGGTSCHARTDCVTGEYCQAPGGPSPTGVALGPSCTSDADCPADAAAGLCHGSACVCQSSQYAPQPLPPGVCTSPCTTDGDCGTQFGFLYGDGTGFVCGTGGHCVPKSCTTASACPANFDCAANQCVRRSCTLDTDCAPSGACVDGACYPSAGTCQTPPP